MHIFLTFTQKLILWVLIGSALSRSCGYPSPDVLVMDTHNNFLREGKQKIFIYTHCIIIYVHTSLFVLRFYGPVNLMGHVGCSLSNHIFIGQA